jgi:predicted small metal-binding protein
MKEFSCGVVVPGCSATFQAESEDELFQQISSHARDEHGIDEVPPEVVDTIRASIVDK